MQPRSIDASQQGRGFAEQVSAETLWKASMRSQPSDVRRRARWRYLLFGERPEPIPSHRGLVHAPGATGICCSGGGIRSAAYNLGALQALQRDGRLHEADYLAGVSGGSYIAAAFCMVGKTSAGGAHDDSDPELIERTPPFAPGSPEEQYLRNRSSYMAPNAQAKAYLALRLVLGLTYNLIFLALPVIGLAVLAGVLFYVPSFGDIKDVHLTAITWLTPASVAGAGIAIGGFRLLRRPPTAAARGFSEAWSVRLMFAAALLAVFTIVLPVLVDAVQTSTFLGKDPSAETVGGTTGGAGVAGLVAGLLASLRQMFASPRRLASSIGGARGRLAKLNKRTRKLVVNLAAIVAGPLLLVTIAVAALTATAVHIDQTRDETWPVLVGLGALALFTVLYLVSDLTTWSLHPFYKRRLSSAFALKRVRPDKASARSEIDQDSDEGIAVERDFDRLLPLSETACAGGPTLVVCAAANISDGGATPPGRPVTSFTFSAQTIGGPLVGGLPTTQFERAFSDTKRQGDLTLPAAVAMSGAALSPSMGKSGNRSFRFLLTLANIRLGVWVPNPRWVAGFQDHDRRRFKRPRPWYLLLELLGRNRVDAKYLYVTDGGHYENLGLVELLRRGCTTVYCFDASGGQSFAELGDAVALARSELGVQIKIDPTPLMPAGDPPTAAQATVTGTITYASGETGLLVYARNVVTSDVPWDVRAHQGKDPSFPHDTTLDQLYTDQKFEAYRALGEHAGVCAIARMDDNAKPGASVAPLVDVAA